MAEINENTLEAIAKGYEGMPLALAAMSEALTKNSTVMGEIANHFGKMTKKQDEEEGEKEREEEENQMMEKVKKMMEEAAAPILKQIKEEAAKLPKAPKMGETPEVIQGSLEKQDEEEDEEKEKEEKIEESKSVIKQDKEEEKEDEEKSLKKQMETLKKSYEELEKSVEEKAEARFNDLATRGGFKKVTGAPRRIPVVDRMDKIMKGESTPTPDDLQMMSYGQLRTMQENLEQQERDQRFPG